MSKVVKSVKVTDKGVAAKWVETFEGKSGETNTLDYDVKSNIPVHPDFKKSLMELSEIVQHVYGFKDAKRITVTGISLSGKEEGEAVVVTAKLDTPAGQSIGIATHRIFIIDDPYGIGEDALRDKVDNVIIETVEYLNGKSNQMKLEFTEEETVNS